MVEYGFEQKSFQSNSSRFIFIFLFLVFLAVWAVVLSPNLGGLLTPPFHRDLLVDFINVGQGDAILLRTPHGRAFLVDAGTNVPLSQAKSEGRELVHYYLRQLGITRLDGVLVTHPHNDHLGGILPVLKLFRVDHVWECGSDFDTATFKDFGALCQQKRIPRSVAQAGDILDWGEELFVQVLHPVEVVKSQEFSDINNMSVVLLVRYGKVALLLTGDVEEKVQMELTRYGPGLKVQVIKVPHHGSETSIYKPFLDLVAPECGVIQVGRDNPFRHPSPAAISLYGSLGAKIYRNDHQGNIRLAIGGRDPRDFLFKVDRDL
ncbi:MAG: MBL fold metallo-hydrolase [Candidatus Riflebacteria bacterium]|nr:MBL fold metallo-hydrolase [Candidatus Riflebacteria bacterium]